MEVSTLSHPSSIPGLRGPSALLRLQSDERLITLTRRGQHAAFEVLCARYQTRLLSFCRHMLASREDAEDVLQEVFAAAFNAVLADERDINVRPWLYRIARNRSLNHLRRASAIGVDSMDIHFAEGGISTGDKVMRRESFRELIGDVHQLPETQRTALLLREIDALSYEQIALAMDTTVPSVKSLLVRARISLAEAAEARKLSCDEVRLELGTVAEGLAKLSTPARRHVRGCERCSFFRKQLKDNNRALALILPVGPLLLVKKLLLAKVGSTASAGGAHVAGGAGAAATATATAGAAAGGSVAGSIVTAGAGAIATKAVAGLAAAALLTAGVAAADHSATHHHHAHASASAATTAAASEPVVVHQAPQPITATVPAPSTPPPARHHRAPVKAAKPAAPAASPATTVAATTLAAAHAVAAPTPPAKPVDPQPVTEVTTQTTEVPASATAVPAGTPATTTTTTTTTTTPTTTPTTPAVPGTPTNTTPTEPAEPSPGTAQTTPPPEGSAGADTDAEVPAEDPNSGGTAAPSKEATGPLGAFSRIRRVFGDDARRGRTADAR
ncbi:MAG TPA: sigma-70 family RNA polymerase sigma factor [Solirubrobacteraceae bacterium]|jgi:RNA polymerase sigma factor (sigma-70 family)|nr:sigma-70 family RNA polymerase sigma factor [Solirubrobacteraceae bacterium]